MKTIIILFAMILALTGIPGANCIGQAPAPIDKTVKRPNELMTKRKVSSKITNDSLKTKQTPKAAHKNQAKKKAKKTANCNMPECKQDTFVDKDGDGINDNRCTGMGISPCKKNKNCKMKK